MKRFFVLLLACLLICASAAAELSTMTIDELRQLQNEINAEIRSRPEWKEVTVPSGTWSVGSDIPAGVYSIRPTEKGGYITILRDDGKMLITQGIRKDDDAFGKFELKDGYTVEIESGSLIFGLPISLGF